MITASFLGHAALLFRGSAGSLVCDPWFSTAPIYGNSSIRFPVAPVETEASFLEATHVYISHHHEDHFHVPSLDRLSRDVTIFIPAFEYVEHPRGRSMERTLKAMGFKSVVTLESFETVDIDIGERVRLTLVPSAKSRWHDWENSGLIVQTSEWTGVNLNDNLADEALLAQIRDRAPKVDVAFVPGSPSTEFPGAFDFSLREKLSLGRRKRDEIGQARLIIAGLDPTYMVPIAGDIAWHRPQDQFRNYVDKPTPTSLARRLIEEGLVDPGRFVMLAPGDGFDPRTGATTSLAGPVNYRGFRRRIRDVAREFLPWIEAHDSYMSDVGFDAAAYDALVPALNAYLPRLPVPCAPVRIDLLIVDDAGAPLRRLAVEASGDAVSARDRPVDDSDCDQEIVVPEAIWGQTFAGKVLRRDLFGLCINRQLKPFRIEVAALRYFITYYFDFGDISPWVRISQPDPLANLPEMRRLVGEFAPQFTLERLKPMYAPVPATGPGE